MSKRVSLFTSESVSRGHPDKICDQISDSILDAMIAEDKKSRVACETLVTTGLCVVAGEVTTDTQVDIQALVRNVIRDIGYTDIDMGFHPNVGVMVAIGSQSQDISQGVTEGAGLHKEQGAGDQGMMFGYACDETPELMPAPIMFSHKLTTELHHAMKDKRLPWLRPDAKSQVTVEYDGLDVKRVHTVVISAQHSPDVSHEQIAAEVRREIIEKVIPADLLDDKTIMHVNPTGRFVIGGPHGDAGLTGRKIIVDTYGGMGRHGGGAFSGKDPSKVDRSAAYMARYVAKNIVAAGLARRCEVQLAYAIGVAEPVSVRVDTYGTSEVPDDRIEKIVRDTFSLTPKGIIETLNLLNPIYAATAWGGHFGRSEFSWEKTDKADSIKNASS
ncbi:MAG: methionine adenosyltransferase [Planctomycetes bacterium]|nr:methionine adenosyltransferase [Planctomycetota bacterium]